MGKTKPENKTGEGTTQKNKQKKSIPKKPSSKNAYKTANQKCTPNEEKYLNYLLKGETQRKAFKKAFPHYVNWKDDTIDSQASRLLKKDRVWTRYLELQEMHRNREFEKTGWTREESIKTLRYVIDKNKQEIERIEEAANEEIELLAQQIQEDPANALLYTQEMLKKRKTRRMTAIHNQGIIGAASELNKMQGFNEENINLNNVVSFTGDGELED